MLMQIVVALCTALVSGGLGYCLSRAFWRTGYSRTDHSGDGGGPRGGVFATMGGAMISLLILVNFGKYFLPAATLPTAVITGMVAGFVGGCIAMFSYPGKSSGDKKDDTKSS